MIQFDEYFSKGLKEPTSYGRKGNSKTFLLLCKDGNFLMNQFTSFQKAFKFICSRGGGGGREGRLVKILEFQVEPPTPAMVSRYVGLGSLGSGWV